MGRIVVVGGHGKVALHFAKQASSAKAQVISLIRTAEHESDLRQVGAQPLLLSLEDASVEELAGAFEGADGVLFTAGAGGKGGAERTKAVDYEGAVKVFDAIEQVQGSKPYLVLVSGQDTRDTNKPPPAHYTAADIEKSKKGHQALPVYFQWKLEADRELHKRTAFSWTILRPGTLTDEAGTGKIALGKTALGSISREDVASTLLELFEQPSQRLTLDLISGEKDVKDAVRAAVEKGVSDFHD